MIIPIHGTILRGSKIQGIPWVYKFIVVKDYLLIMLNYFKLLIIKKIISDVKFKYNVATFQRFILVFLAIHQPKKGPKNTILSHIRIK